MLGIAEALEGRGTGGIMALRMLWFLPAGVAAGLYGIPVARHLFHQGGPRHRTEAWFVMALSWFPLLLWLLNQLFTFGR